MTPARGSTTPSQTPAPLPSADPGAGRPPLDEDAAGSNAPHGGAAALTIGAVGVVFGDIGTSPLYALKESFVGHHRLPVDPFHLFGVISLITWTMITVVLVKYVVVILRADNKGEGGSLALLALINRNLGFKRWSAGIVTLGVFATALFYGDSIITPAISVLSAVEGLEVVSPGFTPLVQPVAVIILIGLFAIQARGTAAVGRLFGPIMIVYFLVLALLGIMQIAHRPEVLAALSPMPAFAFWAREPLTAFLALGSVVLAVTGAEALYADMGHFGRRPIAHAFYGVVGALILNYLGQAALMMGDPAAVENPFFRMAPDAWRLPLVILATAATVIASQAVISGAFSVTQQAIQLGFVPRMRIEHTSASAAGQIYLPVINWTLLAMVILLVVGFRSSSALASAYGIAVTGTMFITSCMMAVLMLRIWKINRLLAAAVVTLFLVVDGTYLASNLTKIPSGGWFPLLIGVVVFTMLTTWSKGRHLMIGRLHESSMPLSVFINSAAASAARVPGTAVFMTSAADGVPQALLHNLKHNKVLHERIILLTVKIVDMPYWTEARARHEAMGEGFHRLVLRYGFMDDIDVPAALHGVTNCGARFRMMDTSFFLSRQTLLPAERPGMMPWRERLFAWMLRNAESAMEYFRLPTNRVVELGSQVEI